MDPGASAIRILIVDDHPIVREGLSAILATEAGIEVVGLAANRTEAVEQFLRLCPDVTLLDVHLVGESGLDVLRDIRDLEPQAMVLMISAYDHGEDIHQALNLGARGYVLKDLRADELTKTIREVRAGGRPIPPRVSGRLAEQVSVDTLSAREREVLVLLAGGLSNRELGVKLGLSEGTAKAHLSHIFEKLCVSDRTQAVLVALRAGLAPRE